jgi:CheY-like chemotaxis protein
MTERLWILLVDDEVGITSNLSYYLECVGFDTAVAADGREALDKVTSFPPDLIVLDVLMPRLDGRGWTTYDAGDGLVGNRETTMPAAVLDLNSRRLKNVAAVRAVACVQRQGGEVAHVPGAIDRLALPGSAVEVVPAQWADRAARPARQRVNPLATRWKALTGLWRGSPQGACTS